MKLLIKLGGTLLDEPDSRERITREIAASVRGHQTVIVHGGGKQMTRFLNDRGIQSRFVDGLRVTTPEVVDALLKVFAGSVNHGLVSAFVAAGARAVGLSGIDDGLIEAEQLREDLGAVGKPVGSRTELLHLLTAHGFLPVVACVAGDRQGNVYNVNADQMAVAGVSCEYLLSKRDYLFNFLNLQSHPGQKELADPQVFLEKLHRLHGLMGPGAKTWVWTSTLMSPPVVRALENFSGAGAIFPVFTAPGGTIKIYEVNPQRAADWEE